jgi:hypothetical protein
MRQRPSKRLSRPIVRRNRPLETARPAETPLYGRRATSRLRTPIASRISRHDPAHTPTLVACRLSVCGSVEPEHSVVAGAASCACSRDASGSAASASEPAHLARCRESSHRHGRTSDQVAGWQRLDLDYSPHRLHPVEFRPGYVGEWRTVSERRTGMYGETKHSSTNNER